MVPGWLECSYHAARHGGGAAGFISAASSGEVGMMLFHVGPWEYWAVIQGQGCSASFVDRTIYIGQDVPPSRRREALAHELWEAWQFHVPAPRTREEQAQLYSTVSEAMIMDLERQGGEHALRAMEPCPDARRVRYVRDEWSQVA